MIAAGRSTSSPGARLVRQARAVLGMAGTS